MGLNILLGSHSTGKTTIIEEIKKSKTSYFITEGFSRLSYEIKNKAKLTDLQQQIMINQLYEHSFNQYLGQNVISTRSPLCTIIYSQIFHPELDVDHLKEVIYKERAKIENIFYIPIEFPMEEDRVRPSEDIRKQVDEMIIPLLSELSLDYTTLKGSVQSRVTTIFENLFY